MDMLTAHCILYIAKTRMLPVDVINLIHIEVPTFEDRFINIGYRV